MRADLISGRYPVPRHLTLNLTWKVKRQVKGHGRVSFSWGLAMVWDYFSAPADVISGRFLVTLPLTLNLTLNVTLKNKMQFIFLLSVLNLTLGRNLKEIWIRRGIRRWMQGSHGKWKNNSRTFPGYSRIKTIKFPGIWPEYLKQFSNTNSFVLVSSTPYSQPITPILLHCAVFFC